MLRWNNFFDTSSSQNDRVVQRFGSRLGTFLLKNRAVQAMTTRKWSIVLVFIAFLLGRAVILNELSPFALAFFGVIYFLRRDLVRWVALSLLCGSLFSYSSLGPQVQTGFLLASILVFAGIQRGLDNFGKSDITSAPLLVFVSSFLVNFIVSVMQTTVSWYGLFMGGVEAGLGFILTLIFLQAIPVFTMSRKNYHLKNEEIICLIILLGSVMTGTVGWMIAGVSIEHIFSRLLILIFAITGGAPLGASVGVVTGLILSLASTAAVHQIGLLAFSGMLAGLLREGRRAAVSFGLLLGSTILAFYAGDQQQIVSSIWESLAAIVLFFLIPRSLIDTVAKYVPGTQQNMKSQYDYAKRVREVTASRVKQFSEVFRQLSRSFVSAQEEPEVRREEQIGHFMNQVAQRACATCWRREKCWNDGFQQTYKVMTDMISAIELKPDMTKEDILPEWRRSCTRTEAVLELMQEQYAMYQHDQLWRRQIQESRLLVAEQLSGVSQVMEDLANEIKREGQELFLQEEQIRQTLEELGLSIHGIDIISLEEGNVEIEMVHQYTKGLDECRKIIAPLLSDILGENIAVKHERYAGKEEGCYIVTFASAKEYEIETGIAGAAKGGHLLSGDSFSTVELSNGKFAVALSDGMGNGERANMESSAALSILQHLLQSGMDEELAIKSVNSVLLLRSSDEMFATVDLALIDQYNAWTTFLKTGSTPSFIKRGSEVITITANNLPIGILQDIDIDLIRMQLRPGDTLVMLTDGIYDAPGHAVNKELWIKRLITEIQADDPQDFADLLLERVVRYHQGEIRDDMTVVVACIHKYQPEWATFHLPNAPQIERPKTVS